MALRNKLFIIGGGVDSCEVYDSASKKFTLLNMRSPFMSEPAGAFAVGEEIFIVSGPKILIYDHVTRKWREKDFEAAGGAENYSCVKIPAICWMLEDELFFVYWCLIVLFAFFSKVNLSKCLTFYIIYYIYVEW